MNRRNFTRGLAATPFVLQLGEPLWGETPSPAAAATITIDVQREIGRIDPKVYGHFIEHVERVVYGGIFDAGSKLSDSDGVRQDVIRAIREMGGAHVLRWPGGNFASYYDWRDGIGPRARRPVRYDVAWKNHEPNTFGTDEYLHACRELQCEPFITANLGDGTLSQACRWVEYTRMQNRTPPVKIWGLGNEHYGAWQVGHYTPFEYGRKAQQFGQFMRAVSPDLQFIGVGNQDPAWNGSVLQQCGSDIDWLSLHLYSHRYFLNGEDDFDSTVAASAYFERAMSNVASQLEESEKTLKRNKPIEICLEEWNVRHYKRDASSGEEVLLRESPRNIVDALFVAGVFNACQRLSQRVSMTNYVFILNAHGPLMVYEDGLLKTALYDVFRLYSEICGPIALATEIDGESFTTSVHQAGPDVPVTSTRVDASATKSLDGRHITLSLINRYKDRPCRVKLVFKHGRPQTRATWHLLRASNLLETNTRDQPDRIRSRSSEISLADQTLELPPASVSHLQVELT